MSFRVFSQQSMLTLLSFDSIKEYDQVRPHHLFLIYAIGKLFASTELYQYVVKKVIGICGRLSEQSVPLVYSGLFPDFVIRWGIRLQLRDHLSRLAASTVEEELESKWSFVEQLRAAPIAVETAAANEQHYEVPAEFYDLTLGPCKKYSSGYWPTKDTSLEESEFHMLDLYCRRANVTDGMHVVDLGCGWGSFTLHLAKHYQNCKITAISNSHSQREYILKTAQERGLNVGNIRVITCNVSDDRGALDVVKDQDLVVSVEMFEHMKNYQRLLQKVHGFLKPAGKLFVHIFNHKMYTYAFDKGWMSENFFTGGTMPSDDLLLYFAEDFAIQRHWRVSGTHYERTLNRWLELMDQSWRNGSLKPVLAGAYGKGKEREWYINWRLFFMACAELFGFDQGQEWIVSLFLFSRR